MFKLCKEEWNFHCLICYRGCILRMLPWPLTEWEEDSWEGWAEFFEWEICSSLSSAILMQRSLLLLTHFSRVALCAPPPRDSPSKNTAVGCRFLLQCIKVKSESEVAQSCLTLLDPIDCSLPGSCVHVMFQARVLEWGAIAFSDSSHWLQLNF